MIVLDYPHGTRYGYGGLGCRCQHCRDAENDYKRNLRRAPRILAADDRRHGTLNGYDNYRCRCVPCSEVKRKYNAGRRAAEATNAALWATA